MTAPSTAVDETGYVDFFNPEKVVERVMLPDGKQWIEIRKLDEGDRTEFQKQNKGKVTGNRNNDDLEFDMDSSKERRSLIEIAVSAWHFVTRDTQTGEWREVPFTKEAVRQWAAKADSEIIDDVVQQIRLMNKWLLADMTSSQIEKELERLNKLLEKRRKMEDDDKSLPR